MKKILLSSVVAIALLTGCGEEKKAETKVVEPVKVEEVKKAEVKVEEKTPEAKLVDQVKESASVVASKIAEESKKVAEAMPEAVESVTKKVSEKTEEMSKEVAKVATETQAKIEASMEEIVATKTSTEDADNGKGLFLKCAGCHGQNGEKPALGKSQVIKGWTKDQTVAALKGYKDGSYGGVMKGVMKSQVMNLSDEEIDALGAYIASF